MRTTLLGLLTLAFAGPAFAAGELQLSSTMPIVLYLDGTSVGTVQPHEPLLVDIEPGVHNLRLQGVLGKDVYDRDLIFDDHTRTELVWQRKELRLGQVTKLDPNRPPTPAGEDDGLLPIAPEHPQAPEAPEPPEAAKPAAAPAPPAPPPPLAKPAEVTEVAAAPPPPIRPVAPAPRKADPPAPAPVFASTAPPVRDVRGPAPVGTKGSGAVVIEAREGLDLQIAHGTQLLRVTVKNGELVVIDNNGTEIHFPEAAQAW